MWRRASTVGARHSTRTTSTFRKAAYAAVAGSGSLALASYYYNKKQEDSIVYLEPPVSNRDPTRPHAFWAPPSREDMLKMLEHGPGSIIANKEDKALPEGGASGSQKSATPASPSPSAANQDDAEEFDLLIIGGGATGAGCAVDAATRGLKVAMLVHGGVRYLEKAFRELDYEQYKLVVEALNERANFLKIAPYLSYQLPIMLPIYKWWQVPYYWVGSKAYDLLAGHQRLESSYFLTKGKALEAFPMLKNDKLVGAMVYYDGQHNDSRMNVVLGLTAVQYGAVVANHVEVVELHKDENKKLCGARCRDVLTGREFDVKAKGIINATGPFTDGIRKLDEPSTETIVSPSAGVHIILPNYYSPGNMGLLDPETSDGRVIFFLPWQGNTIAGTTDSATDVTPNPRATEEEIDWILGEVKNYLNPDVKVRRGDVLAAWSGIRPLVRDPAAKSTEGLVRNHMINVSKSGLLTIAGGKWTTYRAMAEETIDEAIKQFKLQPMRGCSTERVKLIGSHGYSHTMFIRLIQQFGLETDTAQHLANSYGDRAWAVASLATPTGLRWPVFGKRLSPQYPYIEAEVRYAVRREFACTAVDVLARRTRLAFLNASAALEALPYVVEIMSEELQWDEARKQQEVEQAKQFLTTMGMPVHPIAYPTNVPDAVAGVHAEHATEQQPAKENSFWRRGKSADVAAGPDSSFYSRAQFNPEELAEFHKVFGELDRDGDGHIDGQDLEQVLKNLELVVDERVLSHIIEEVDLDKNGAVEFNEFLEVMSAIKDHATHSEFSKIVSLAESHKNRQVDIGIKKKVTDRSGGGV
ncbi:mitochondrial glycerol-3-phosphate dehydrogenase [Actinomortierella ambigua]|nr:mitochondrial glycerol-3-phosphate dehydrogenase [Actinomortierella ambigua]